ncbi:hypothetical protein ACE01N_09415 [Saccharicrinis sp. FJH2]|uniref:hypothetical protein n=1 Tax=Saccharicrinis sp. FJH65 TaxID=3344659 RepID=UPI0035F4DAB6
MKGTYSANSDGKISLYAFGQVSEVLQEESTITKTTAAKTNIFFIIAYLHFYIQNIQVPQIY